MSFCECPQQLIFANIAYPINLINICVKFLFSSSECLHEQHCFFVFFLNCPKPFFSPATILADSEQHLCREQWCGWTWFKFSMSADIHIISTEGALKRPLTYDDHPIPSTPIRPPKPPNELNRPQLAPTRPPINYIHITQRRNERKTARKKSWQTERQNDRKAVIGQGHLNWEQYFSSVS